MTSSSRACSRSIRAAPSSIGRITTRKTAIRQASSCSAAGSMSERVSEVTLASASPRRLQLLESLGLRVVVVRSTYEERDDLASDGLADLALRHALGKAAGADPAGPPLLVAADTVVDVDGNGLAKPRDD